MSEEAKNMRLQEALLKTRVLRLPKQRIFTFWDTQFQYHIVSKNSEETSLIKSGSFSCTRPVILNPTDAEEHFQGFDNSSRRFAQEHYKHLTRRLINLGYRFENRFEKENLLQENIKLALERLLDDSSLDNKTSVIIQTEKDFEQLGLIRAAMEMILRSLPQNFRELKEHGLLDDEQQRHRSEIEILFYEAEHMGIHKKELGKRLQAYGLFEEYEERFFKLF